MLNLSARCRFPHHQSAEQYPGDVHAWIHEQHNQGCRRSCSGRSRRIVIEFVGSSSSFSERHDLSQAISVSEERSDRSVLVNAFALACVAIGVFWTSLVALDLDASNFALYAIDILHTQDVPDLAAAPVE